MFPRLFVGSCLSPSMDCHGWDVDGVWSANAAIRHAIQPETLTRRLGLFRSSPGRPGYGHEISWRLITHTRTAGWLFSVQGQASRNPGRSASRSERYFSLHIPDFNTSCRIRARQSLGGNALRNPALRIGARWIYDIRGVGTWLADARLSERRHVFPISGDR